MIFPKRHRERYPAGADKALRDLILESFYHGKILPDSKSGTVSIDGQRVVRVDEGEIDAFARDSGLVNAKWLIYSAPENINDVWKAVAQAFIQEELGNSIKVPTATPEEGDTERYLICVYTANYLDTSDVQRVRDRLRSLGFDAVLYYKPDLCTYLQIYRKNFPRLRASRYSS
jgi:Bles03-like protein